MDNTTVLSYLKLILREGTSSHSLNQKAREITLWCLDRYSTHPAVHLSGTDNINVDLLFCCLTNCQTKPDKSVEGSCRSRVSRPSLSFVRVSLVDLFMISAILKVHVHVVYRQIPEPLASRGNAIQTDWARGLLYIYPPTQLLRMIKLDGKKRGLSSSSCGGRGEVGSH